MVKYNNISEFTGVSIGLWLGWLKFLILAVQIILNKVDTFNPSTFPKTLDQTTQ